jgi:hypothetical protein
VLNSLVVAEPVLAAALKSPEVAETAFSETDLPAAPKSLLTILAAVLPLVAMADSERRSVRAVCSERFSRASRAATLLLVIRVAAPAEAFLLPLHRSHRLHVPIQRLTAGSEQHASSVCAHRRHAALQMLPRHRQPCLRR